MLPVGCGTRVLNVSLKPKALGFFHGIGTTTSVNEMGRREGEISDAKKESLVSHDSGRDVGNGRIFTDDARFSASRFSAVFEN